MKPWRRHKKKSSGEDFNLISWTANITYITLELAG